MGRALLEEKVAVEEWGRRERRKGTWQQGVMGEEGGEGEDAVGWGEQESFVGVGGWQCGAGQKCWGHPTCLNEAGAHPENKKGLQTRNL